VLPCRPRAALINVTRDEDGIMRDIPLYEVAGGFGIPSLPLRLASQVTQKPFSDFAQFVRPNWRKNSRLPRASAADFLVEGAPVCGGSSAQPPLKDRIALVGYTASGLNDAKPTPVDAVMPGVEVLAEATEALVAGKRHPRATGLAQVRDRGDDDVYSPPTLSSAASRITTSTRFFVATNLALLIAAFIGLTFFGTFSISSPPSASSAWYSVYAACTRRHSGGARSATATTCPTSIRRRTAGWRSRACTSCRILASIEG
jgi:hypothetical protein